MRILPAGTRTVRSREETFSYFLVAKPEALVSDIKTKEYFVYRFIVPVSSRDGIKQMKSYFSGITLDKCQALTDVEYATGNYQSEKYQDSNMNPLTFKLKEIPIYFQKNIRVIDLSKDIYSYGSKPIIKDETAFVDTNTVNQRRGGNLI